MTCFGLSVCLDQYLACGAVSCLLALLATPKGCQFCVAFSYRAFLVEHRLVFFLCSTDWHDAVANGEMVSRWHYK